MPGDDNSVVVWSPSVPMESSWCCNTATAPEIVLWTMKLHLTFHRGGGEKKKMTEFKSWVNLKMWNRLVINTAKKKKHFSTIWCSFGHWIRRLMFELVNWFILEKKANDLKLVLVDVTRPSRHKDERITEHVHWAQALGPERLSEVTVSLRNVTTYTYVKTQKYH